jgi:hypothetical protein
LFGGATIKQKNNIFIILHKLNIKKFLWWIYLSNALPFFFILMVISSMKHMFSYLFFVFFWNLAFFFLNGFSSSTITFNRYNLLNNYSYQTITNSIVNKNAQKAVLYSFFIKKLQFLKIHICYFILSTSIDINCYSINNFDNDIRLVEYGTLSLITAM